MQGHHIFIAAGDVTVIGAQAQAHFRHALVILHLGHAVEMVEAVVQKVRPHLGLNELDLRLVGHQLALVRLLHGLLELVAYLHKGAVQKVHVPAARPGGELDPFLLELGHFPGKARHGLGDHPVDEVQEQQNLQHQEKGEDHLPGH